MDNISEFTRPWRIKVHGVQGVPERYLEPIESGANELTHRWYCFLRVSMFHGEVRRLFVILEFLLLFVVVGTVAVCVILTCRCWYAPSIRGR